MSDQNAESLAVGFAAGTSLNLESCLELICMKSAASVMAPRHFQIDRVVHDGRDHSNTEHTPRVDVQGVPWKVAETIQLLFSNV